MRFYGKDGFWGECAAGDLNLSKMVKDDPVLVVPRLRSCSMSEVATHIRRNRLRASWSTRSLVSGFLRLIGNLSITPFEAETNLGSNPDIAVKSQLSSEDLGLYAA